MSSILTVTQINTYLSLKFKGDTKLRGIAIKGEISDFSVNQRSGHAYFSLRDQGSALKSVMFRNYAQKLKFQPFDGMSVVAYGNIDVYVENGIYELNVTQMTPDGAGNAYLALLKLKEKLNKLGIFSAPKKPIPRYPSEIAVVTSPTGAAIQDVRNVVSRRYPLVRLTLYPTAVQGADAPFSIASALALADASGADTIILTRGGGASEDLSAFNTEIVTMAVYNCKKPVISAVGHEIDWSLSDLAADLRASTPTGAAELATPDISEMKATLSTLATVLMHSAGMKVKRFRDSLQHYEYALAAMSVKGKIKSRRSEVDSLSELMERHAAHKLAVARMSLEGLSDTLAGLDPKNVLSRGYALVYKDGGIVSGADKLVEGDDIRVVMRGGSVGATVNNVNIGDKDEI